MKITHNISALNTHRILTQTGKNTSESMEKLSSGLRINQAADDAAGLAISEKMRGQIRGLEKTSRNIQDGISLLQTAEGALNETHSLLQRGRELSVQAANDTLTQEDKAAIQKEVEQIKTEIDSISKNTEFNKIKLLNRSSTSNSVKEQMLAALPGMLQNSEAMIRDYFGLTGDNQSITIFLDDSIDGASGTLAYVSASINPMTNEGTNIELHVDMSDFTSFVAPNGNDDPFNYLDRTIAHEMVHAVFDRTLNMDQDLNNDGSFGDLAVPKWFNEGSAEYLKGGADRLFGEVRNLISGGDTVDEAIDDVLNAVGNGQSWGGESLNYAAAYAAVRYLDANISAESGGSLTDYKDFLGALYNGGARDKSVDDIFNSLSSTNPSTSWGSLTDFINDFKTNGHAFVKSIYTDYDTAYTAAGGDVSAIDVGSIITGKNADNVVEDTLVAPGTSDDPMQNWIEIFPSTTENDAPLSFHIGANSSQTMDVALAKTDSASLGLNNVDVSADAQSGITSFDNAITTVSGIRSRFGAMTNRLEHALSVSLNSQENITASESRIRDVDMAQEMMNQTKNSILSKATQAMLAQANQQPQGVLQLLG
ncbi:flagellinolysin [Metabacillus bambusae]|uniref:Flagellin n=1 Tax=Metabacillus bambusae TaxID=2795218 RepID=A0ABS3N1D7_9BACI|nr:flagellinolysin [Metabacillus bambusae]MBO1511733.1 flagellinolysin [Metabacillus bambusae]